MSLLDSPLRLQKIMTMNAVATVNVAPTGNVPSLPTVAVDTMLIGDPVASTSRVLDLSGLSWSPSLESSTSPTSTMDTMSQPGFVTVDSNATLYLRDLVMYNLQAAVQTGSDGAVLDTSQSLPRPAVDQAPTDYSDALKALVGDMGNFTSLLWFFNFDRSV